VVVVGWIAGVDAGDAGATESGIGESMIASLFAIAVS